MKAGWKQAALGDVCDIYQPKTISTKDMTPVGEYSVFGANGIIGKYHKFNHEESQLLITCRGATCGSVNISEPFSWITGNAMVVRPKVTNLALHFVEFFFRGAVDLGGVITGAAQPQITRQSLAPVPIPLPPLEEQQQIVAVLDEAFEGLARARAHAEANLGDARELFSEVVTRCFLKAGVGATETTLGSLAEFRNGLNYTRTSKGKSVKIVGVGDFKDHFTVPVETLSEIVVDGDLASEDRLRPGDLLAVRSNGNRELIGRTMLVPDLTNAVSFSGFTIRIRLLSAKLLPEYLCEFMRTKAARRMLIDGGGGSNISNLNQKLLSSLPIAFPSITDQRSILEELDGIRAKAGDLVGMYETKIRQVDALRQSLLQKAFAGELT